MADILQKAFFNAISEMIFMYFRTLKTVGYYLRWISGER